MKKQHDSLDDDNLTTTFARMIYFDIQRYIYEHLDEFENWKKEQELSI